MMVGGMKNGQGKVFSLMAVYVGIIYTNHLSKEDCGASKHTKSHLALDQLTEYKVRCHKQFRMVPEVFLSLCELLTTKYVFNLRERL